MTHSFTTKKKKLRYRYYVCMHAQKRGWANCPSKSVPAAEIERFVVDQIKAVGRDPALVAETLAEVRRQTDETTSRLRKEQGRIERDVKEANAEMREVVAADSIDTSRMADLNERVRVGEQRLAEIRTEMERLQGETVTDGDVAEALAAFDPVWEQLSLREQSRILQLLIERVDYDGEDGSVAVTFRPTGIATLTDELQVEEAAA